MCGEFHVIGATNSQKCFHVAFPFMTRISEVKVTPFEIIKRLWKVSLYEYLPLHLQLPGTYNTVWVTCAVHKSKRFLKVSTSVNIAYLKFKERLLHKT